MVKLEIKKKILLLGDTDSINIEIIAKSFKNLRNKTDYILLCNRKELSKNKYIKKFKIEINEVYDPIKFTDYKKNYLNIFNIEDVSNEKYLNLINQIKIGNNISNKTKFDLVTMPINKSIFKKKMNFVGMTEYLGKINSKTTVMLMYGNKFSVIPYTTHINIKKIHNYIRKNYIENFLKNIFINLNKSFYKTNFKDIKFLCYNPHCSENGTLGKEDILIKKILSKFNNIKGPLSADSAFNKIEKSTLFISTYHDQVLIPFKILNRESLNLTLGLNYRRLSPAHGTAKDIKNKNIADNKSYLKCLLF